MNARLLLNCALAGCVATLPMTVWMLAAQHFLLPRRERYALPPEQITEHAAEKVGLEGITEEPATRRALTLLNHFAYGTVAGIAYAPLARLEGPPVPRGVGFGSALWALSYFGLLPALGLLSSAEHHPRRRSGLMLVAHFIWGGVLAARVASSRAQT